MEHEKPMKVSVERLRLDRDNPRLVGETANASDESIIARLYRSAELDELLESISANGYLDIEPLVVTSGGDEDLIVLEGNRRLAALRLLREPDLGDKVASSENLRIRVPPVPKQKRVTFDTVSVYPVAGRAQARSFIGFKHINGPAKWDAYAKGKFAAEWYKAGKSEGVSLDDISRAIGDRHDTVKRMVSAIYVLDQAATQQLFDVEEDRLTKKFNFSHLYTALGRSQYMDYLGLGSRWARYDPSPDPVPAEKLDELRKVLMWIYGSKRDDALPVVRSQNPDIKRLGEVLANAEGRLVLEATRNLDQAYSSIESVDTRLTTSLIRARDAIREAAGSLRAYDGRDQSLLDIAGDVKATAESVYLSMSSKFHETSAST